MDAKPRCRADLLRLHRGIQRCRKCRLHESRLHAVPGEGPCDAPVMLIGEAPGAREDREGRPFCGASGAFLDTLLQGAGIARQTVYVTSSVKCRPPHNRRPRPDELQTCRQAWLDRQIAIVRPRLVVLLGSSALRQVLGGSGPVRDHRARVVEHSGRMILATYHPAAGMRFPETGRRMREDFARIGSLLAAGKAGPDT